MKKYTKIIIGIIGGLAVAALIIDSGVWIGGKILQQQKALQQKILGSTYGGNVLIDPTTGRMHTDYMPLGMTPITLHRAGVIQASYMEDLVSSTVSGVTTTWNLTLENTSTGTPIFNNVFFESVNFGVNNSGGNWSYGDYTFSADKRQFSATVTKLGTSNTNVLINLVGGLTSVVSGLNNAAAPNGTVVNLDIKGN